MPFDRKLNSIQPTESKLDLALQQLKANAEGISELNRLIREGDEKVQDRLTELYRYQSTNHDAVMEEITKVQTASDAIAFDVQAAVTETFEISKTLKTIKRLIISIGTAVIIIALIILYAVSQSQTNVNISDVKDAITSTYDEYFGEYGMTLPDFPEIPPLTE